MDIENLLPKISRKRFPSISPKAAETNKQKPRAADRTPKKTRKL